MIDEEMRYVMRIMTFNLRCDFLLDFNNRWDSRKHLTYKILNDYKCDIIGTQELTNRMHEDIKNNIKNYNIIGKPRSKKYFSERNDILVLKNHKISEMKTFWLSNTPDKEGSSIWYSLFPRICTTAIIEFDNKKRIRVCNSHLDCLLPKAREEGLKKLIEVIKIEQKKEELPIIIMGDFNAKPDSSLIKNFTNGKYTNKRLVAVQEYDENLYGKATMGTFKGKDSGIHIDYIFVSEEFEILNTKIIKYNENGKYPSDHYPLMADLKLK